MFEQLLAEKKLIMYREQDVNKSKGFNDLMGVLYLAHSRVQRLSVSRLIRQKSRGERGMDIGEVFEKVENQLKQEQRSIQKEKQQIEDDLALTFAIPIIEIIENNIIQKRKVSHNL